MKKKLLKISIIGKTNSGKSTLLNNLIKETVSIINKKINTTEDIIKGIINIKNNQLIFHDTPGYNLFKNTKKLNNKLKVNLLESLYNCDLIIFLIDIKNYNLKDTLNILYNLYNLKKEIVVVFNKNDLVQKRQILPKINELSEKTKISDYFSISAKKKLGLENLIKYLLSKSYYSNWIYENNEISDKNEIFITNEITRNSVLTLIHKESPYNIEIENIMFKFLKNGDLKIKQNIKINNSRYKKIILGKDGLKIKDIRKRAQNNISKILNIKVHLYIYITKSDAKKI